MKFSSNSNIARGCRLCAVLGMTLLVGIAVYADSTEKTKPAARTKGTVDNLGSSS